MSLIDRVRDRILSGAAAADRPIRQDALAAELGISKIPLREALVRLEQEGLVRAEANRGFFVRPLTAAEAAEVYDLRLTLEPDAAAAGALAAGTRERTEAEAALAALSAAIGRPEAGTLNRAFHLALVQPARRPVTADILARLHILSERYVRVHLAPSGRTGRATAEHRALLDAWLERRAEAVAALTRAHLAAARADLLAQLGVPDQNPERNAATLAPSRSTA